MNMIKINKRGALGIWITVYVYQFLRFYGAMWAMQQMWIMHSIGLYWLFIIWSNCFRMNGCEHNLCLGGGGGGYCGLGQFGLTVSFVWALWGVVSFYPVLCQGYTVVPVMNGHSRDQAKVSVHCRWPLIRGTGGQAGTPNTIHLARLPIFLSWRHALSLALPCRFSQPDTEVTRQLSSVAWFPRRASLSYADLPTRAWQAGLASSRGHVLPSKRPPWNWQRLVLAVVSACIGPALAAIVHAVRWQIIAYTLPSMPAIPSEDWLGV